MVLAGQLLSYLLPSPPISERARKYCHVRCRFAAVEASSAVLIFFCLLIEWVTANGCFSFVFDCILCSVVGMPGHEKKAKLLRHTSSLFPIFALTTVTRCENALHFFVRVAANGPVCK